MMNTQDTHIPDNDRLDKTQSSHKQPHKQKQAGKPNSHKPPFLGARRLLMHALLASVFTLIGVVLLLGTFVLVYQPMRATNDLLKEQRLQNRMQLSTLIADVFPSMNVNDQLSDVVLRALENKKVTLKAESQTVAQEIETLRNSDEIIAKMMVDTGYDTLSFTQIVKDAASTERCLAAMNLTVSTIDSKIETLGVAKLKEEIDAFKGTTSTVTREDENGETITETVTVGGLIPEAEATKRELSDKCEELKTKLDELDTYLDKNAGQITAMYNRLDSDQKENDIFGKMKAITAYANANAQNNMFLQDVANKLNSFPGQTKEEDDILFIMKVESETGIKMQTVNYGQDYQHKKLSNGMLLCYEAYAIPYRSTYQGLKNLIAYFNQNDDFYASIYTLSMQYDAATQTIQGTMIILHYYLLTENAEYVPPSINEEIVPGIDGIFGEVTDNGKTHGKQSPYTVADVKAWLEDGMSFEDIRDKFKSEGYPATEFAWVMKEEYSTPAEMQEFLDEYGEEGVEYNLNYVLDLLECDLVTLMDIYYSSVPEDTTASSPEVPKEDATQDENSPADPEETTDGSDTTVDPEETTDGSDTTVEPEETTDGSDTTVEPEETTGEQTISQNPKAGKQSDYTVEQVESWMHGGMSLVQVRDLIKAEGYPATELAWILKDQYNNETDITQFMLDYQEVEYASIDQAAALFECSLSDLNYIYNY